MLYNIYWIEEGEQAVMKNAPFSIIARLTKSILEDGWEITGIIASDKDN